MPDWKDGAIVIGLSLIGVGTWWIMPAASLIVVGVLVLVAGVYFSH